MPARIKLIRVPDFTKIEDAEFVGLLIGDGSISRQGLTLCCLSEDVSFQRDIFHAAFGERPKEVKIVESGKKDMWQLRLYRVEAVRWVEALGIWSRVSGLKKIPNGKILNTKSLIGGFLRGLFEADGSISTVGSITLSAAYYNIIVGAKELLSQLEIGCSIRSYKAGVHDAHELYVYRSYGGLERFRLQVGFLSERKVVRLAR